MNTGERAFLDTSALAKWYLNEAGAERFVRFLQRTTARAVSRLALVEIRSLLGRRRRAREITAQSERLVLRAVEGDVAAGFLEVHPLDDLQAVRAAELMTRLRRRPLRTLDALHLAAAEGVGYPVFATADRVQAGAARAIGLRVRFFG